MKLSISNIAWNKEQDEEMYQHLEKSGYQGLEIAPTRIFDQSPYTKQKEAKDFARRLWEKYGLKISSMQSIWFGRVESIFGTEEEREQLLEYTKAAAEFAHALECQNMVFGSPKNRNLPEGADAHSAVEFFHRLGEIAKEQDAVIAMEANPPIYNTNYINDTKAALLLVKQVSHPGFLLNLDAGTMIENGEQINVIEADTGCIHHVHISEPFLAPIEERALHRDIFAMLKKAEYQGYVSIEMKGGEGFLRIARCMEYVNALNREVLSKAAL